MYWYNLTELSDYEDLNIYKSENYTDLVLYPSTRFTKLEDHERVIFFILFLLTFSLSMIGNIATLFTTYQRKIRLIQKMLIISLAWSDIIVCMFIGINNMINFSHPMTNWILGEFMCSFIPYVQILGSVANSVTMVSIAFDRYKNILQSSNRQWNPNIWWCIVILLLIWGLSAGASYPMYAFMYLHPIKVIITDKDNEALSTEILDLYLCITNDKIGEQIFYSIIFSLIFIPLMIAFLWFYFKIAQLIWKRRKPVNVKSNSTQSVTMETSTDSKTSTTPQSLVVSQVHKRMKSIIKTNKLHMERKIRTFKIILIIMLVFFICRMPHWIFTMIKLSRNLSSDTDWVISNALSLLLIMNTTLNPFLYSFLNQTIMYFDKFFISVGDFISKICCCCCTNTEFDDFEKDNPFCPDNYDPRPSQTSSIIPRGPYCMDYNNCKPNHVKFLNVAVINMYPKENSSQNCNTY